MSLTRRAILLSLPAIGLAPPSWAQLPPARLRGTVTARNRDRLEIATRAGETMKVVILPDTSLVAVVPAKLDDIKPGSFIGTAAMPGPNGTLIALEVHVFPESMRGTGEGHRPFDLQPESTMTNGTVGDVTVASGRTLTVGYKGGTKTVTVPPDAPVVGFEPATPEQLAVGAHVIVFGTKQPDGSYGAARVLVGKDGLVPPM